MTNRPLQPLIDQNRAWSEARRQEDPEFFSRLVSQQEPEYLWIGCADSRVPANEIVGLMPGELFVHRNVANVVVQTDLNCLSVLQYAVEVLKVKHILVVGHYGCGGVQAALERRKLGLIDNWLRHVQSVADKHQEHLNEIEDDKDRVDRLCELNVIEQVVNVCKTTVVENAWASGQQLTVNGWTYRLNNGLVRDLQISVDDSSSLTTSHEGAVSRLHQRPVTR
ncbi:carbonate dehydratase [Phragmitibacter flavus]|uniref:Carbonic anhydrase n=1 Tax=Phragmitibacter flavus TaxID=2576071 RepID=A0A5R8KD46_9BACT|nr:carbonate dehydratase [Phragmitibacter flavus]TLD69845.1 carbonate dehydratase [Phragmitibacter flavus]